jgi:hypothetical protein
MKKTILAILLLIGMQLSKAQLHSAPDNTTYGIAQMIAAKANEKKLGAIHSESPTMRPTAGKDGYFLRYQNGWVYYNPKLNQAFALWGKTMQKYQEAQYETGWLGFPASDPKKTPNRTGSYQHFDNGSIYYSPSTGYHYIAGAFREYWKNRGWENSPEMGFPKTDEVEIFINGYTRYQQFEKGTLFFAQGKDVLYTNNPNATTPLNNSPQLSLQFEPQSLIGWGDGMSTGVPNSDLIDLYGWMDIRVYKADGKEISDESNKSFSIFYIPEKNRVDNADAGNLNFKPTNTNFQRSYNLTQAEINANAYIRITYWLNDHDDVSSNDYLKLQAFNGSWNYNNGKHPYREIKIKDIDKNFGTLQLSDLLEDGLEKLSIIYNWKIIKK